MGTKGKIDGVFKFMQIVLDWVGVDSILLDPTILEILYFKQYNVEAFNVVNFNSFYCQP